MADERVNFVLGARDNATATIKRVRGELSAVGGTAGKAAGPLGQLSAITGGMISPATLAAGAIAGVAAGALTLGRAAMDEERGVALLTAAVRANDSANVQNMGSIEGVIKERQRLGFADDVQRESLGALIAVTQDSNKALELQRTAMDLARLKGMDLGTATTLIGKVYGGNVGILSRYGIQLDKNATSTEAIAAIQERAAGQAEQFADTTAGAMESASLVIADVGEDIGALLLPAMRDLALWVRDELVPAVRGFADGLGAVIGPIASVAGAVAGAAQSINSFITGLDNSAIQAFAEESGQSFQDLRDRVRGVMEAQGVDFATAWEVVKTVSREGIAATTTANWQMHQDILAQAVQAREPLAEQTRLNAGLYRDAIAAQWADVRSAAFETAVQNKLGILDGQNEVKVAFEALTRLQEEEQTRAQRIAYLQGQLNDSQLAAGLNDGRPGVSGAARAIHGAIVDELATLGVDAYNSGASVPGSVAAGIRDYSFEVGQATSALAAQISGILPRSEPKDPRSPLRGITKVGPSIPKTIAEGIRRNIGLVRSAFDGMRLPDLGGAAPAFATGGAAAGSGGAGAGAITIVFNSTFPPTPGQAQAVARQLIPELVRELSRQGKA